MAEATPAPKADKKLPTRRLVAIGFLVVLVFFLMRTISDPWGDAEYLEVSHGNHSHFVPKDRDVSVDINRFPTQRPGPNQRILPDGRVVSK